MCGRIAQFSSPEKISAFFRIARDIFVAAAKLPEPRHNIAPTANLCVVANTETRARERGIFPMRWGFSSPAETCVFNARAETAGTRPMFAEAVHARRCIVPVDGFFEWKKEGRARIPFYFSRRDGKLLALGAIARRERGEADSERVCVMTTAANETMAKIHVRMPVILEEENFDAWLSGEKLPAADFSALTRPAAENILTSILVSPEINRADAADSPALIAPAKFPVAPERDLFGGILC